MTPDKPREDIMNYTNYGNVIVADSAAELFKELIRYIKSFGKKIMSRNGETLELIAPTLILTNPKNRLLYWEGRKFNLIYALTEAIMLFSPSNKLYNFTLFNKNMANYSDDGKTLNSAYGQYVANQIPKVIELLKRDANTRQAVISIYNNTYCNKQTKDVPCTIALNFLIRNNALDLIVYMRSNDMIWGLQYDMFMFTYLQEVVANELGINVGVYVHCPTSLHVYEHHYNLLETSDKINYVEDMPDIGSLKSNITNAIVYESIALIYARARALTDIAVYNTDSIAIKLIKRELIYRNGLKQKGLTEELSFAKNFTKRWFTC